MRGAGRKGAIALGVGAAQVVTTAVHASAPSGQYDTFFRNSTCIVDLKTKLTWQRAPLPQRLLFDDAATQCAALGAGWRVPTVNELSTLVDEQPHLEDDNGALVEKAIDANAFPGTPVDNPYWTSSVVAGTTDVAWDVAFSSGATFQAVRTTANYVRCVLVTPSQTPAFCTSTP
jgi:hypothetical protein